MLASSCSDDDEDTDNGGLKDCVPTLVTTTEGGATNKTTIGYNGERQISSVMIEGDGALTGTVAYSNGKPSKFTVTESELGPGSIEYTYNSGGQLTQMNLTSSLFGSSPVIRYTLEYNGSGQVSKIITSQANPFTGSGLQQTEYSTFTYDSKGNIQKESVYTGTGAGELDYTIDYTYDNNVNPANALEKLIRGVSSPNNILTAITKGADGTVFQDESYSNVYKYNSDNYPTEFTQTMQSGTVSNSKVTYDCK
ncbi:hypothetical protein GCM10023183_37040 [Nibribacter koreensis]|uniref:YD repeat-containing protein n=2 Tax=Nibribacter koreensis TaxID=1084519 RepID=A0ABP8G2G0_9BACT